ncbi:iduronate 2-sulfatase-like [Corticium candelabrum]|uniref:iduronate 2-sulfatase-like n=1 Tax=Corticium candelabrum TaxID=121492 RepID=UPI002E25EEA0|nr:iduronate 2-sulfatase-like [Corticium candelabrum]
MSSTACLHLLLLSALSAAPCALSADKKNVLFFVSDDMRPELTVYDGPDFPSPVHPKMHSPNLDALAAKSLLLKRAYVQQAVCSPSRTSLLTGRRPDTTHVYDLVHYFRKVGGNFTTIPQYFKQNGYLSIGMGKIFHPGSASDNDDPISWSEPYFHANDSFWGKFGHMHSHMAVNNSLQKSQPLPDQQIADHAVEVLKRVAPAAKSGKQPFFVAVGFHRPHLPFIYPDEFQQYYPESEIRLPDNEYAPINMPPIAWSNYGELLKYGDISKLHASGAINSSLPPDVVKSLRRDYYGALSFTDSLIGKVMEELENLGLAENTIISFWGDHGWQLGEHGEWCKHTNFEDATHAPMMVHIPGKTDQGIVTEALTEFVDLFPTLVDAANLPPLQLCPQNSEKTMLCREGASLMPLIENPNSTNWKTRAFSQYPRQKDHMGYTMRTDRYRYTEWVKFDYNEYKPDWNQLNATELYDHQTDPEENHNVASEKDMMSVVKMLSEQLHAGWRSAMK